MTPKQENESHILAQSELNKAEQSQDEQASTDNEGSKGENNKEENKIQNPTKLEFSNESKKKEVKIEEEIKQA